MRKIAIFVALAFLLVLCAAPVYAQPKLPHAFYGSVTINNASAPDGTQISATVNIGDIIATQNPVTTVGGSYGIDSPYLLVQGYGIPDGATITFYVKGVQVKGVTATFEAGGGPTPVNLSVTIPRPAVGVGAPAYYLDTDLFGIEESYRISSGGKLRETIEAASADGMVTIAVPKGTVVLDKDGERLELLVIAVDKTPPPPPQDSHIIGLAYSFEPEGATFDPPISLPWSYDPEALPQGVAEEDLVVAYYDQAAGEWVECECICDPETHCITACICHFTCFAIIGAITPPPPPAPAAFSIGSLNIFPGKVDIGQTTTISIVVANTGGESGSYEVTLKINGVVEATKEVTVHAGSSKEVTFTISKDIADTYSVDVDGLTGSFTVKEKPVVPVVPKPVNWPLIGGIIAAVVVGLLIFFWIRRRAT